jgi:hypothetical protein
MEHQLVKNIHCPNPWVTKPLMSFVHGVTLLALPTTKARILCLDSL